MHNLKLGHSVILSSVYFLSALALSFCRALPSSAIGVKNLEV